MHRFRFVPLFSIFLLQLNISVVVVDCWSPISPALLSHFSTRSNVKREQFFQVGLSDINDVDFQNNVNFQTSNHDESKIYFDISLDGEEIGRMVFNLGARSQKLLPKHTENLIKLCGEDLKSIDPKCSYVKCAFKHSPQFVETMPQYRWAHVLDGRGRNAVGRAVDRISDPDGMRSCTHSCYGGVYYGLNYDETIGQEGVVLTVPLVGAYRGSTSFSIVRVGESPQEWREKLLLNSAVLGWLESGIDVLHTMARQTQAPPIISGSGRL